MVVWGLTLLYKVLQRCIGVYMVVWGSTFKALRRCMYIWRYTLSYVT